jgi:FtsH-binding integral membrane protein
VVAAALLDVVCILVFVSIGRTSHDHGVTAAGVASTSWPFLVGAAVGWLAVRAWRRPQAVRPTGVGVLVACVVLGMVLRVVSGQGTAAAFIVVAFAFLGLALLGWRALWGVVQKRVRLAPDRALCSDSDRAGSAGSERAGSPDQRSASSPT